MKFLSYACILCWVFTVTIYIYYALIIWLPPPLTLPDGP